MYILWLHIQKNDPQAQTILSDESSVNMPAMRLLRETQLSATRSPRNYTSNTDWWGRQVGPKCGSWTTASSSPSEPVKDAHVWASSETRWVLESLGWTQQSLLSSPSDSEEHLHWRSNGDKDSSNKTQKAIPREEGVNTEAPTDLIFSFWKRLQPKLIVVIATLLPKSKGPFFLNCLGLTFYRTGYHLKHRKETLHPALFFLTMPTVPGTPSDSPKSHHYSKCGGNISQCRPMQETKSKELVGKENKQILLQT